jgi:hypothetical protein
MEKVVYQIGQTSTVIVAPRGFVTDFASIPEAFWSFGLSAHGRYSKAAIVHDYLGVRLGGGQAWLNNADERQEA